MLEQVFSMKEINMKRLIGHNVYYVQLKFYFKFEKYFKIPGLFFEMIDLTNLSIIDNSIELFLN